MIIQSCNLIKNTSMLKNFLNISNYINILLFLVVKVKYLNAKVFKILRLYF